MTVERCITTKAEADAGPDAQCVGIAKAAEICADIGRTEDAVRVTLDPLLYEAKTLVNAASILNRMKED